MRRARLQIGLLIVVFVALGLAAARARRSSEREHAWVRHSYDVELAIGAARSAIGDAERGQTDFAAARATLDDVCSLTSDGDVQESRCDELRRLLAGPANAPEARALLSRMMSTEQSYLRARRVALEHADATNLLVMRIAFGVAFFTTIWLALSRERQRRAHAKQSAFFASVLESIGEAVLAVDRAGTIVVANAGARARFPAARTGRRLADVVESTLGLGLADGTPLAPSEWPTRHALAGDASDGFLFSLPHASDRAWLKASSRAVCDESGALLGAVTVCRDVTAEKNREDDVRALAVTDALTGCHNRRGFFMLAEQHARLAARMRAPFTVIFADLDGLKQINDVLGHDVGDAAIAAAAELFKSTLRESDIIARLGGDEFVLLATQTDAPGVARVVARVQQAVERFNASEDRPYQMALSFGCATFDPASPQTLTELVADADRRMYAVKRTRKRTRVLSADHGPPSKPSIKIAIRHAP